MLALGQRHVMLLPVVLSIALPNIGPGADKAEQFETKIRPLLARNCFACHTQAKLGGLTLDTREGLLKGGKSGPAVVPGDPEKSLLFQAISHTHPSLKMPPNGELRREDVEAMGSWIRDGAFWPEPKMQPVQAGTGRPYEITAEQRAFWSFQKITKPQSPDVRDTAWVRSPVDRFVLSRLEQKGMKPAPEADRRTWIRRLTFDLTGLPPTPGEVAEFEADGTPAAYEKVVDRLLASPRYGERWARHWLDIMRYSDDVLDKNSALQPAFFRYRDWLIKAFNDDQPYSDLVRAHLAADLDPGMNKDMLPALTAFVNQSTEFEDDERPDVLARAMLGLTVGCARCHNHKYDPIPTRDFYSLLGIFRSTNYREVPLAGDEEVAKYKLHQQAVAEQGALVKQFLETSQQQAMDVFAARTYDYLMAVWRVLGPDKQTAKDAAATAKLDEEIVNRWLKYWKVPDKRQPYLRRMEELVASGGSEEEFQREARAFHLLTQGVLREKKETDEYNKAQVLGAVARADVLKLNNVQGKSLNRDRYMLWQELCAPKAKGLTTKHSEARFDGVYLLTGEKLLSRLPAAWKDYVTGQQEKLAQLKNSMPEKYAFVSAIEDDARPENLHVFIRGNPQNLGEEAPRAFLSILRDVAKGPFAKGSGRLELAEAIVNPENPLTARVMANRIWEHHFGMGEVRTPSDFGQMGDRPANPALLDYLASRFVEQGWSIKKMHREIALSMAYRLSSNPPKPNLAADPDNRLHSWYSMRRLEAEAIRDSMLFVSGALDEKMGGEPQPLGSVNNRRRTIYGLVSRNILDPFLALFDFPSPNVTNERRVPTTVPIQRLFLLNSDFVMKQADTLAARLDREKRTEPADRVSRCYELLFQRRPSEKEMTAGVQFTSGPKAWQRYAHTLLMSDEFLYLE